GGLGGVGRRLRSFRERRCEQQANATATAVGPNGPSRVGRRCWITAALVRLAVQPLTLLPPQLPLQKSWKNLSSCYGGGGAAGDEQHRSQLHPVLALSRALVRSVSWRLYDSPARRRLSPRWLRHFGGGTGRRRQRISW
ncbi:unnamed protein product, partial [Phaeothamnion confervicola]